MILCHYIVSLSANDLSSIQVLTCKEKQGNIVTRTTGPINKHIYRKKIKTWVTCTLLYEINYLGMEKCSSNTKLYNAC